jgi:hypothetical protein
MLGRIERQVKKRLQIVLPLFVRTSLRQFLCGFAARCAERLCLSGID